LPQTFHTSAGFEKAKALLHAELVNTAAAPLIVLGIGLGLRDIARQQEIEPGTPPPGVPQWLLDSALTVAIHQDSLINRPPLEHVRKRKPGDAPPKPL
jgi:hypothetical protein